MNEKTMMLLALALGGYVLFIHNGGMIHVGPTAASPAPPPTMPQDNTGAIAEAVGAGLDLVTAIFNKASGSTASRGSGVANA